MELKPPPSLGGVLTGQDTLRNHRQGEKPQRKPKHKCTCISGQIPTVAQDRVQTASKPQHGTSSWQNATKESGWGPHPHPELGWGQAGQAVRPAWLVRPSTDPDTTCPLAGPVTWTPEIGSTNDEALAQAKAGAPHGAVVVAERQTAGRGRRGRSWSSPAGLNLYVSVILRPRLAHCAQPGQRR